MYEFAPGSTGVSLQVLLRNNLDVQPRTGLVAGSAGARAGYVRQNGTAVSFALVPLASDSDPWTAGGFLELDPAIMPGSYRLDVPDAANAAGASFYTVGIGFDGVVGEGVLVLLRNPVNNVGPGAYTYTFTVEKVTDSSPIAGASLWVSTDAAGSNVIAGALSTGAVGTVAFLLDAGTYYLWVNAQGYAASNPTAFTVSGTSGQTISLAASSAPPSLVAGSGTHASRVTAYDLTERLQDFVGADPDSKNYRTVRRSILDALREFATSHPWTYLRSYGRITLCGDQTDGTVEFDLTGGTYERQLTLTDATWPSWAAAGSVRIGDVVAKVDARVSDTVLTLKSPCFIADIESTTYTLYRDSYTLPADYVASDNALAETSWGSLCYVPYNKFVSRARYQEEIGEPRWWTLAGDPDVPGRLAMYVYPAPDTDGTLDFMYYRKPRDVRVFDLTTGTVTVELGNPTLATFSNAVLTAEMAGSVLRLAGDASEPPDGRDGVNPYLFEANIVTVLSTTTCQLDTSVTRDFDAVAYRVSDPIDAEDLQQLLLGRAGEKHLALSRLVEGRASVHKAWLDALVLAKEADSRVAAPRAAGVGGYHRPRLADMPIDWT